LAINKPKEKREIFFEELQNVVDKLSNNEKIFIMGNFNSKIENIPINIMHLMRILVV